VGGGGEGGGGGEDIHTLHLYMVLK
jgi:hypothetical protein